MISNDAPDLADSPFRLMLITQAGILESCYKWFDWCVKGNMELEAQVHNSLENLFWLDLCAWNPRRPHDEAMDMFFYDGG